MSLGHVIRIILSTFRSPMKFKTNGSSGFRGEVYV